MVIPLPLKSESKLTFLLGDDLNTSELAKMVVECKCLSDAQPFDDSSAHAVGKAPILVAISLERKPGFNYVLFFHPYQAANSFFQNPPTQFIRSL